MEVLRFQEEIDLLENEMMAFMKFYKDTVLPSLDKEKEKLENLLKGISVVLSFPQRCVHPV